jgi:hypothetical protein
LGSRVGGVRMGLVAVEASVGGSVNHALG